MEHKHYIIKNGLLHRDGKPIFAIGTSYYPSYHARKVSVPEDGDRIGEMYKDLQRMADAGIHLVRCASLGRVWYDETKKVCTDTPFIDAMIQRAEECGLGVMVRLQGYSMNLSGWDDAMMIDSHGAPMDTTKWYDFIQNSFYHEGIVADNDNGTRALAKHFAPMPAVLGFQTYNEPHYPSDGIFDYHPDTIRAFRKWLCAYMPEQEAMNVDPPRERPSGKGEDVRMWVLWRLFAMQSLSDFLNHCSDVAKDATGLETMTCLTTDATNTQNAARGVNLFDSARHMDALGITQYYMITKPEAYLANLNLDLAESAASTYQKPLWLVEYDARTDIPLENFRRLNYLAIGAGCKGIMHYQWRGDHIFPDSPEGNGFGFLNYDGTKTANFDNALNVIALINRLSDVLVHANKLRSGVAILHSDDAYLQADGTENGGTASRFEHLRNSWLDRTLTIYTELRKANISPDFTRARDLAKNPLGVMVLFVPSMKLLSDEERARIEQFVKNGGKVVCKNETHRYQTGYLPYDYIPRKYKGDYDMEDILEYMDVTPAVRMEAPSRYLHQTLAGKHDYVVVVTNTANLEKAPAKIVLKTQLPVQGACLYTFENQQGTELPISDGTIVLKDIADGAIVVLRKGKDAE